MPCPNILNRLVWLSGSIMLMAFDDERRGIKICAYVLHGYAV
jgi:hypothetical protein